MKNTTRNYFIYFSTPILIAFIIIILFVYNAKEDHISEISLHGNNSWYMNFKRSNTLQFQDRDIFYHNIGNSIEYAKQADIIILGHSMILFGLDHALLEKFARQHNIKIYNLGLAGDASGEFALRIIEKYHLHPSIFILNADDHEVSFFSPTLKKGKGEADDVISYSRWHAYKNIIGKNLRWRLQNSLQERLPNSIYKFLYPQEPAFTYRSIEDGNWNNDYWPKYNIQNPMVHNQREPNCHAKQEEFHWAVSYLKRLGKSDVIFTLIPYINSCRPRVTEIANYVKKPFIPISPAGMSYFDGSGHLDKISAEKATLQFLKQLEQQSSFIKLLEQRKSNPGT